MSHAAPSPSLVRGIPDTAHNPNLKPRSLKAPRSPGTPQKGRSAPTRTHRHERPAPRNDPTGNPATKAAENSTFRTKREQVEPRPIESRVYRARECHAPGGSPAGAGPPARWFRERSRPRDGADGGRVRTAAEGWEPGSGGQSVA
jgi:hypothetical protein